MISTTTNKTIALGNGVLTVFNFLFAIRLSTDMKVIYVDAAGNETDVTAQTVVALNAVAPGQQWAVGGTCAFTLGGTPIPAGSQLTMVRTMPLTQAAQFTNQGGNFPVVQEQTADILEMQLQQIYEYLSRVPLLTQGKDQSLYTLALNPVANALLGWDATGKVLGTVATAGVNLILPGAAGIVVYTGGSSFINRTITGTANEITVTNGAGTAGNPTISLPVTLTFTGKTITGGTYTNPAYTTQALVDGAAIAWNMSNGHSATLLATAGVGNTRAIAAPTNIVTGGIYYLSYTQDAFGGRQLTFNAAFRNLDGSVSQPAMGPGAMTNYVFRSPDGVNLDQIAPGPIAGDVAPNLIVNPNWILDQVNEGALYTVNTVDVRGPDGWSGSAVGAGIFKLRTLADPDNAALKCMEITCTTADAAIAAADDYFIYTAIEGYDASTMMAGTAFAIPFTVRFKFKCSVAGTYGVSIANSALNRRYVTSIVVPDANEHEYILTVPMDTAGTWLYTNGVGLYMRICLAAGANFQAASNAWAAGAEQTVAAQANFMSNIANIAYLKRVRAVPGALVQAYQPIDAQKEIEKAQRYYSKTYTDGVAVGSVSSAGVVRNSADTGANTVYLNWRFPVSMRATPTALVWNPNSGASGSVRNETAGTNVAATFNATYLGGKGGIVAVALAADSQVAIMHATADVRLS